jgi:hypothetical protein
MGDVAVFILVRDGFRLKQRGYYLGQKNVCTRYANTMFGGIYLCG